jgi:hypothetical protein
LRARGRGSTAAARTSEAPENHTRKQDRAMGALKSMTLAATERQ